MIIPLSLPLFRRESDELFEKTFFSLFQHFLEIKFKVANVQSYGNNF